MKKIELIDIAETGEEFPWLKPEQWEAIYNAVIELITLNYEGES